MVTAPANLDTANLHTGQRGLGLEQQVLRASGELLVTGDWWVTGDGGRRKLQIFHHQRIPVTATRHLRADPRGTTRCYSQGEYSGPKEGPSGFICQRRHPPPTAQHCCGLKATLVR